VPLTPESLLLTLALCGALCLLAYYKSVLTWDGSVAAFGVGLLIGALGDVTWLLLLLFFLLSSFVATRYRFALKEALGVQEGRKGERRSANVLANGIAPVVAAIFAFVDLPGFPRAWTGVVFVSVLAVAGADTLASEIGVLSSKTYLITNGERVRPGTNGGVSVLGQACALLAALYTGLFGWLVLGTLAPATMPMGALSVVIPVVVGFAGCQIDSVLGATLENRGIIGKRRVNLISTCLGGVLAFGLLAAVGAL
jgi:uncharacterized protein (TIGR00297 family)